MSSLSTSGSDTGTRKQKKPSVTIVVNPLPPYKPVVYQGSAYYKLKSVLKQFANLDPGNDAYIYADLYLNMSSANPTTITDLDKITIKESLLQPPTDPRPLMVRLSNGATIVVGSPAWRKLPKKPSSTHFFVATPEQAQSILAQSLNTASAAAARAQQQERVVMAQPVPQDDDDLVRDVQVPQYRGFAMRTLASIDPNLIEAVKREMEAEAAEARKAARKQRKPTYPSLDKAVDEPRLQAMASLGRGVPLSRQDELRAAQAEPLSKSRVDRIARSNTTDVLWAAGAAPTTACEKKRVYDKCGSACFLVPNTTDPAKSQVPVCARCYKGNCACKLDCRALRSVSRRADKAGSVHVRDAATSLMTRLGCAKK